MAVQEPQPPDSADKTPWFRRLWRRRSPAAGGDVIAATVASGSQGVAVGKNIIQIGTLQIPIWALVALLLVFVTGFGVVAYQLTPRGPEQMRGVWNIAVAPFVKTGERGLFGRTATDTEYSEWVFNALENQKSTFQTFDPKLSLWIWNDSMPANEKGASIGPILGNTADERRQEAYKVANRLGADVIIYGNIDAQNNFYPEFYVKPQLERDVDSIAGHYQLGSTPIQINPADRPGTSTQLATRANALFWLVVGVDYIVRGDTEKAFGALDRAQQEFSQIGGQNGEDILFFFRGQAQLYQARDAIGSRCDPAKVMPYLDSAQSSFEQALGRNPNLLRARVALSGVYQQRALCVSSASRLDSPELAQALDQAKQALEMAPHSDDRITAEGDAVYQLGIVYNLFGSTYLDLGRAALDDGKNDLATQQLGEAERYFDLGIAQVEQSRAAMSQSDNPQRALAIVARALGNATAQKAIAHQVQQRTDDLVPLYTAALQYYQQCIDQGAANASDNILQRLVNENTVGCVGRAAFVRERLQQLNGGSSY